MPQIDKPARLPPSTASISTGLSVCVPGETAVTGTGVRRLRPRPGITGVRVSLPVAVASWGALDVGSYGDRLPGGHDGQRDAGQHFRAEEHGRGLLAGVAEHDLV